MGVGQTQFLLPFRTFTLGLRCKMFIKVKLSLYFLFSFFFSFPLMDKRNFLNRNKRGLHQERSPKKDGSLKILAAISPTSQRKDSNWRSNSEFILKIRHFLSLRISIRVVLWASIIWYNSVDALHCPTRFFRLNILGSPLAVIIQRKISGI